MIRDANFAQIHLEDNFDSDWLFKNQIKQLDAQIVFANKSLNGTFTIKAIILK